MTDDLQRVSGVDNKIDAGDKARIIRSKIENGLRDFLRTGKSPLRSCLFESIERRFRRSMFLDSVAKPRKTVPDRRPDAARTNGVEADFVAAFLTFFRDRFRKHAQRGLACGV